MNRTWWGLVAGVVCGLTGCSMVAPAMRSTLGKGDKLDPSSGYVAGVFTKTQGGEDFAFVLTDQAKHEQLLWFTGKRKEPSDAVEMYAVPPGDYRVAFWWPKRTAVPIDHPVGRPFTVKPGQVVFVGKFEAKTVDLAILKQRRMSIEPQDIKADEALTLFRAKYPGFAEAVLTCHLCIAPATDATQFAMPAPRPAKFEGK